MKKIKNVIVAFTSMFLYGNASSQSLATYSFSAYSGTYTANVSPIVLWVTGDDVTANNIPIGFKFNYAGSSDSVACINSNGWIALGSAFRPNLVSHATNNLPSTSLGPVIAPLWDDLKIGTGNINYQTTGSVGNRVFTVEWLKMKWYWATSVDVISFQVKLYELNGDIEFIYRQESGNTSNASASIGINNASSTDYWSLNNTGTSPTAFYGSQTNTISTKPANGQVYKWSSSSTPTGISNREFSKNNFVSFPNPFDDEFTFYNSNTTKITKIQIVNTLGECVLEKMDLTTETKMKINMSNQPSGIYFLNVFTEEGKITNRIVKN